MPPFNRGAVRVEERRERKQILLVGRDTRSAERRHRERVEIHPLPRYTSPGMATVELTRHLYRFFPQLEGKEIVVPATTVAEVVAEMEKLAPGFAFYVCDERGRLRVHVNIFVGDERIVDRVRLSDPVAPDARVFVLQALSGG